MRRLLGGPAVAYCELVSVLLLLFVTAGRFHWLHLGPVGPCHFQKACAPFSGGMCVRVFISSFFSLPSISLFVDKVPFTAACLGRLDYAGRDTLLAEELPNLLEGTRLIAIMMETCIGSHRSPD